MSQPEYYDRNDSYRSVHYATNPQNSNPPQNNPNNFNNQRFTNTAFYSRRQTANNQQVRTNPWLVEPRRYNENNQQVRTNPWLVEPGRHYENQTQASYNRVRYPQASDRNFRGNYNNDNFNAFKLNQNHYNYRFDNGPPVGQSGPPPVRSNSNNTFPSRVWGPPNQPENNKPPYKLPQNTKPKNNFNKGKQTIKKRSPKKQNKSFKEIQNQNTSEKPREDQNQIVENVDKTNEPIVEVNSDEQRKVGFQTENAQIDQTKNTNDNIGNGQEKFEIAVSPAIVKRFRTKWGKQYLRKLKKKYSTKFVFECESENSFILKVDCPIEHSKTVNDKIRNYIGGRESIQLEKIQKDFAMLPEIFKLANPDSLLNRWEEIKRENTRMRRPREHRLEIKQIKRELCAFFIGKEKLHDQQQASHSLDVLEKFFSSTANQDNLDDSVIKAHEFIFLNNSLPNIIKKWEELHKKTDKTDSVQERQETENSSVSIQKVAKRQTTQKTAPKRKNTNDDFAKYTDELLAVCKSNRLKSVLELIKKKINLNQFNDKAKKRLLRIGRRNFKIPYGVEKTT